MAFRLIRFGTDLSGYDPEDMLNSPDIDFRRYWKAGKNVGTLVTGVVLGGTAVGLIQGYLHHRRESQRIRREIMRR